MPSARRRAPRSKAGTVSSSSTTCARRSGQQIGGHISPLGAYDEKKDRFLILDVARYKYPPVWVKASDLFDAMNTTDASNGGKTRGYVVAAKAEAAPAAAPVK